MIPCIDTKVLDKSIEKLTSAYRDQPNILVLLSAVQKQCQLLEDATWRVLYARLLGTCRVPVPLKDEGCCDAPPPDMTGASWVTVILDAEGAHLDLVGQLVGEARGAKTDEDYRVAIKARVRVNKSDGLSEDLLQITRLAIPYGTELVYTEPGEAEFNVSVPGFAEGPTLAANLRLAKMGGVRGVLVYGEDGGNLFRFGSTTAPGSLGTTLASTYGATADASLFAAAEEI